LNTVFVAKLPVAQLFKKLSVYMLLWQQQPVKCPYPEPAVSIPQSPILFTDTTTTTTTTTIIIIIIIATTTAIYSVQLLLNLCILLQQIHLTQLCRAIFTSLNDAGLNKQNVDIQFHVQLLLYKETLIICRTQFQLHVMSFPFEIR
jgi:hypothetical protein